MHFWPRSPLDCCRLPLIWCVFIEKAVFFARHFVPSPLFSWTSPEVPSFLTSLRVNPPFRTLKSIFVSRHNWRRLESSKGSGQCIEDSGRWLAAGPSFGVFPSPEPLLLAPDS